MSQSAIIRTPEVLASIAQELEHAGELCDRLETLVTQLVRASRGEPLAIALHEAQTLDVLTQHRRPWPTSPASCRPRLRAMRTTSPTPSPASLSATSPTGWRG